MKRFSIAMRANLLGIVPAFVLFLLLSFYFMSTRLAEFDRELYKRGEIVSEQLAPLMEYGVLVGDRDYLMRMAQPILNEEDVVSLVVENAIGTVLLNEQRNLSTDDAKIVQFQKNIIVTPLSLSDNDDPLLTSTENSEPKQLGRITVTLTNAPHLQQRQHYVHVSLILVGIGFLIAYLVARIIARSITQPIQQLSLAVQDIKRGQYTVKLEANSGGEIGSLEQDIRAMAAGLEEAKLREQTYTQGLEKARIAAESASHAKSQFMANMSHELRTPMNGTLGMLQLLQETPLNEEQRDFVETACESTDHLLRVVNDILDFSKLEEGKLQVEHLWFDPVSLLNRTILSFQNEARLKQIELINDIAGNPEHIEIFGDPVRLRQVLVNLIGNAVKFTEKGHVCLRARWQATALGQLHWRLDVIDTGIGIAPEKQPLIFDAFTQADGSMTRRYGGTGLGLSICRQLVQLMNGELLLQSSLNQGSQFSVILTSEYREQNVEKCTKTAETTPPLHGKVLLVEDNMVNQAVTQGLLRLMGLQVDTVNDGIMALACSAQHTYDIVIMDCQMPKLDGFETTRRWRQREHENNLPRTPIIALTANALGGDKEQCLEAGMDDYLSKPVSKIQLQQCISRYLNESSPSQ